MKINEAISILATSPRPREHTAKYDEAVRMAIEALREKENLEKYPLSPLLEELYKEGEG